MALPRVDSNPTPSTPSSMTPPLTNDSSVHDAWERLRTTGDTAAVVMCAGYPVAVVTRRAVERALAAGKEGGRVGSIADLVTVPVDRSADALATVHVFTRVAWDWLQYDRGQRA